MTLYVEAGVDVERLDGTVDWILYEAGALVGTVTIATGQYFLRSDGTTITRPDGETSYTLGYSPLTTAIKAALELAGVGTYTVTFDAATERLTIAVAGVASFRIVSPSTWAQKLLGYTTVQADATSHVADRAPWCWIKTSQGILSDYFWDEEEDGELGEDNLAQDGIGLGTSEDELAVLFAPLIPLEPRALVWNEFADPEVPFTWQRLCRHARNIEPLLLDFQDGEITRKFWIRLTREGRVFKPLPRVSKNHWTYADIKINARLLGKT